VKDEDLYRERLTFQPWKWTVMQPSIDHSVEATLLEPVPETCHYRHRDAERLQVPVTALPLTCLQFYVADEPPQPATTISNNARGIVVLLAQKQEAALPLQHKW
jgi:hypothetical protein